MAELTEVSFESSEGHEEGGVTGDQYVGGLAGQSFDSIINNSYSDTDVIGNSYVGGFVGNHSNSTSLIENSFSEGDVFAGSNLGGFVGYIENQATIFSSYSTGDVNLQVEDQGNNAGGFVGRNSGYIYNSYSEGDVESEDGDNYSIGGFAGYNGDDSYSDDGLIQSSFSVGSVAILDTEIDVGGFIGTNYGYAYEGSGWWTGSGPENAIGNNALPDGGGDPEEVEGPIATIAFNVDSVDVFFSSTHGVYNTEGEEWDFNDEWVEQCDALPRLYWEEDVVECVGDTDDEEEVEENTRRRSSGSSVRTRVKNLEDRGQNEKAQELIALYPNVFSPNTNTPSININVRDLQFGDTGEDVKSLQSLLIRLGYSIPAGPTGYFGLQTRSALIAYQKANNIYPSIGYFGPVTRAFMKSLNLEGLWW